MGIFVHDRVRIPAGVSHRGREVNKEDLLPLHDEMAQVEHCIMHHSSRMDLAQRQHRQTTMFHAVRFRTLPKFAN